MKFYFKSEASLIGVAQFVEADSKSEAAEHLADVYGITKQEATELLED